MYDTTKPEVKAESIKNVVTLKTNCTACCVIKTWVVGGPVNS